MKARAFQKFILWYAADIRSIDVSLIMLAVCCASLVEIVKDSCGAIAQIGICHHVMPMLLYLFNMLCTLVGVSRLN